METMKDMKMPEVIPSVLTRILIVASTAKVYHDSWVNKGSLPAAEIKTE